MSQPERRDRYHHGDLANALAVAALDLARKGGPEAVVLREAARQVGVSATAAYRHFASHDDLVETVRAHCQVELVGRMETQLAAGEPESDPGRESLRRLRALGRGYIEFARSEPGIFQTAFCRSDAAPDQQWDALLTAPGFVALIKTLDEMRELGIIDDAHRSQAEFVSWSMVHGLAMLFLDGPLGTLPPPVADLIIERTLDGAAAAVMGRDAV
jgi:AcrR family transcriptional regulator